MEFLDRACSCLKSRVKQKCMIDPTESTSSYWSEISHDYSISTCECTSDGVCLVSISTCGILILTFHRKYVCRVSQSTSAIDHSNFHSWFQEVGVLRMMHSGIKTKFVARACCNLRGLPVMPDYALVHFYLRMCVFPSRRSLCHH